MRRTHRQPQEPAPPAPADLNGCVTKSPTPPTADHPEDATEDRPDTGNPPRSITTPRTRAHDATLKSPAPATAPGAPAHLRTTRSTPTAQQL
ncbi:MULTISPECIES: hypothetical protein [Streptomyces]|uniref:hypothetical protein n=1 Tax=Streptomyces TaxID=1883 RepID=UPI0011AFECD9|nr:hypothetical protein [Streptomyces sp. ZL-24]